MVNEKEISESPPPFVRGKLGVINQKCKSINPFMKGSGDRARFHSNCVHETKSSCNFNDKDFDQCISDKINKIIGGKND